MYRCRAWITYADTRRRRRAPWIRDRRSEADLIAPPEPSTAVGPDRDLCACSVFVCGTGSLPWRHRSSSRREVRRGMDGFEVCSKPQADSRGLDVPVIMLTAKSMSNDRSDGFNVGADDCVTKPFEPMELVARVAARLHQTTP